MPKDDFKFHTSLRVRWMECDAQGIVFNGAYLGYLEVGQAEYFRNLGFSIYQIAHAGYFDMAVVKTVLEYKAPARVDEMLDLYVGISNIGNTSMTLDMEIHREGNARLLTVIQGIYVGYDATTSATLSVPAEIRELITGYESTGEVMPLGRFPDLAEATASGWSTQE